MYNTPFNYNVLINPYIKNHFKYINIYCLSFNFRKMYQLMLLADQNVTVLLNPIALFNKCNTGSYTDMSKFKHSVTLLQNSCWFCFSIRCNMAILCRQVNFKGDSIKKMIRGLNVLCLYWALHHIQMLQKPSIKNGKQNQNNW